MKGSDRPPGWSKTGIVLVPSVNSLAMRTVGARFERRQRPEGFPVGFDPGVNRAPGQGALDHDLKHEGRLLCSMREG
jgi:hypothetical protein